MLRLWNFVLLTLGALLQLHFAGAVRTTSTSTYTQTSVSTVTVTTGPCAISTTTATSVAVAYATSTYTAGAVAGTTTTTTATTTAVFTSTVTTVQNANLRQNGKRDVGVEAPFFEKRTSHYLERRARTTTYTKTVTSNSVSTTTVSTCSGLATITALAATTSTSSTLTTVYVTSTTTSTFTSFVTASSTVTVRTTSFTTSSSSSSSTSSSTSRSSTSSSSSTSSTSSTSSNPSTSSTSSTSSTTSFSSLTSSTSSTSTSFTQTTSTTSSVSAVATAPTNNNGKAVFAHVIVGVYDSFTSASQWAAQMQLAQGVGIDAFALNFVSNDNAIPTQLAYAFQAAQSTGFKLFFSFDYAGGPAFSVSQVVSYMKQYGKNSAYYYYKNLPLVSTFEGPSNSNDWTTIKQQYPMFFMPDWASQGCGAIGNYPMVDGAFSWDSWPVGPNNMNTQEDQCWISNLNGKPYMMGASPMFYTNLPEYNKNWLWRGDTLWHDRWQEIAQLQPQFVEIQTWNDFGEAHYIGPLCTACFPGSSGNYDTNMPHDGWRALLPYYISQYKTGSQNVGSDKIVVWSRQTPAAAGNSGGTSCDAPWQTSYSPSQCLQDSVFVAAAVTGSATVQVQIGSNAATTQTVSGSGVNMLQFPFNGQTGQVTVKIIRNGATTATAQGTTISSTPASGNANFNMFVATS